ncbi:MAG TPA: hypothetical protein VEX41_00630 [Candidatus Eisenbacteria bacterium]|nr:hypothetical protein [Candidatus Eisenbacteria bacterium]
MLGGWNPVGRLDLDGSTLQPESLGLAREPLHPYIVEHVNQHLKERDPSDEGEFAFGLDLIFDGLQRIPRHGLTPLPE